MGVEEIIIKFCSYQFYEDYCGLKGTLCILKECVEYSPCDTSCTFLYPEISCLYEGDKTIAKRKCNGV